MMMSVKNHQVPPTTRVETARGLMSDPCCMRVPTTNQNALERVKVFSRKTRSGSATHGRPLYHSYGEKRASTNIARLTATYALTTYNQISGARGLRKKKSPGLLRSGRLNRMLIPRFMNGLVKSITCSRR